MGSNSFGTALVTGKNLVPESLQPENCLANWFHDRHGLSA